MLKKIRKNLKDLGFNHNESEVYIALTQLGESSSANIAKKCGLPRTTVISILEKLEEKNYLSTHRYRGTTYFWIESPRTIKESLLNRAKIAEELNGLLTDLYRTETHFPHGLFYDTKSGIKAFIEKMLINAKDKSTIYTIDSPSQGNYSKIFSDNFGKTIADMKKKKNLTTKTLVPYGSFKGIDDAKLKSNNMIIREMPAEIKFKASFWLMNDSVVFFSGNPPFISASRHEMIYDSMKSWYEYLWSISKEMK